MMGDFKAFLARGNVLDLAVAVIIGAAFATIVSSLTDDVIMPIVGALFGGLDFSNQYVLLGALPEAYSGPMTYAALKEAGVPMLGYGQFLTTLLKFVILAFVIFQLVRMATQMTARRDAATDEPEGPAEDIILLRQIRDELQRRP